MNSIISESKLYIRLSDTDISFACYDGANERNFKYVPYHAEPSASLTVNLREAFRKEPSLKEKKNAEVLVVGPVTLVPLDDFQEEDCDAYYYYCFPQMRGKRVFYDSLPSGYGAVLLFSFSEQACQTLEDTFESVHFVSAQTSVLKKFSTMPFDNNDKKMFVNLHGDVADISVFCKGRILIINSFSVKTTSDGAFFALSVFKNLNMDTHKNRITVSGTEFNRVQLVDELRKYVVNVNALNTSENFNNHPLSKLNDIPFDLLSFLLD